MNDSETIVAYHHPPPWNKGKLIDQKPPLKLREIWTLRTRLEMAGKTKELALFNLAIDSKLRGCDVVQLRVNDVARDPARPAVRRPWPLHPFRARNPPARAA